MRIRRTPVYVLASILILITSLPAAAADDAAPPAAVPVVDGRYVHTVGELGHHVTNWGLIGSAPGLQTSFSDAPSAQWPIWSGNEYLWAAGLWVGGVVAGEPLVTTGGFSTEFLPTDAPGDTIFPTFQGAPGGTRYPWTDGDDDGDGLEDEEVLDGLDNDGDGLVDEDYAAFGDQEFVATYNDFEPEIQQNRPDHTPLHIEVVQRTAQWSAPHADDFVGYDFTITNTGAQTVDDVYLGLFSDCDIGPRGFPGIAGDDYAGYVSTTAVASDGTTVPVAMGWMRDGGLAAPALDGWVGWVLCDHTVDPAGAAAPTAPTVTAFQRFSGNVPFEQGGDPTNDAERYQLLASGEFDPDVLEGRAADYRFLLASGPFTSLAPGQSLTYRLALVVGPGRDGLIANAAEAVAACRGATYDRDGDPANGEEWRVPWVLPEDAPVPAWSGRILAEAAADGAAELLIEADLPADADLAVVRRRSAGVPARRWERGELEPTGRAGLYRLRDADPVGWPRTYELVTAAGSLPLDEVAVDLPGAGALALSAGPNPFNPQVTIRYALPAPGRARLQVFDLRGRLVRTLLDEPRPAGAAALAWSGDDDVGRDLPSGVYLVRLDAEGREVRTRVTLAK